MLHEYCLNALVGLSCDPARTFRVAALECSKGKWPLTGAWRFSLCADLAVSWH